MVVFNFNRILWNLITTPVAPSNVASRHFFVVAASPPQKGGENAAAPDIFDSTAANRRWDSEENNDNSVCHGYIHRFIPFSYRIRTID